VFGVRNRAEKAAMMPCETDYEELKTRETNPARLPDLAELSQREFEMRKTNPAFTQS
jgi:hypothetical protein